jgi:23S rRNA (adenine2503-C2)-methyltransferase
VSPDGRSCLAGFERDELDRRLSTLLEETGEKSYRTRQIIGWLYRQGATDFARMSNVPAALRAALDSRFSILSLAPAGHLEAADGTEKFLWETADGHAVESVYMPSARKATVCISTQAGCPLGCAFCATGEHGFSRNLAAHEIVSQVLGMRGRKHGLADITNLVFMGMGEPLLNYAELAKTIRILNHPDLFQIGARRITVSTAGIPEGIRRLARDFPQVKLALSLGAPSDALRTRLMPVNRRFPLREVMDAVKDFTTTTGKRVTFEYVMIPGVNDSPKETTALGKLIAGIPSKVNLIPLNRPGPGAFRAPSAAEVERFRDTLMRLLPVPVTLRKSMGGEIMAACGQLAGSRSGGPEGGSRSTRRAGGEAGSRSHGSRSCGDRSHSSRMASPDAGSRSSRSGGHEGSSRSGRSNRRGRPEDRGRRSAPPHTKPAMSVKERKA